MTCDRLVLEVAIDCPDLSPSDVELLEEIVVRMIVTAVESAK